MARYDHLKLVRIKERLERRKKPGFGSAPVRERDEHTDRLREELNQAIESQRQRRPPAVINPSLILRVQMTGALLEEDWESLGLTVVSSDEDRTLVLFSSSQDMDEFRRRLDAYSGPIPANQKNPSYANFVAAIESIGAVEPKDRIGLRLREAGFTETQDFPADTAMIVDLEIWDLGRRDLRERKLDEIAEYVGAMHGEELDRYVGPSIAMLRLRATGVIIRALLAVEEVASIDLPPVPDVDTGEAFNLTIEELPKPVPIDQDVPIIGIIDSGVNAHPLIEDILVGSIGVPEELGEADDFGHGTRVSGVAVFGDLSAQLRNGMLLRGARICSAKVVDNRGQFPDKKLVPSQMRQAITELHQRYGCRIFVIALADTKSPYKGGKVGAWAATLDELVRELNIAIFVSAGNRYPRGGNRVEEAVTDYPRYLLEPENRIFEPAGAVNVITVGSLAHGEGLDEQMANDVRVRPITHPLEPSPFTRIGPGVEGAVKPDLVEVGGTMVYDPVTRQLRRGEDLPSAGVLTLHHRPVDRLFSSGSGTSYSAPLVAFKASQILRVLPNASANLIRALVVGASAIPDETLQRLRVLGDDAVRSICGHGLVDAERAAYSDDARVVLYTEDELSVDYFAVYEIPIPQLFQTHAGRRTIKVTLAYDPPVRHSRSDYAGIGMNFRLVRGCPPDLIFEHYRRRAEKEGKAPDIEGKFQCSLLPGPQSREKSTVQSASATFKKNVAAYGDSYHLVVRCEGGWAADVVNGQRFAVVVEISHEAEIELYQRVQVRVRA